MDKDSLALIVNGVVALAIVAGLLLGKVDLPTAIALLGAASAPGAGNLLLGKLLTKPDQGGK